MIRPLLTAAALSLLASTAHAETLYVRAGHLVDTEAGTVLGPRLLRVEDGRGGGGAAGWQGAGWREAGRLVCVHCAAGG